MRYLLLLSLLTTLVNHNATLAYFKDCWGRRDCDYTYGIPKVITGIDNPEDCASVGGYWDKQYKKCLDKPRK